jgi:hypothetical protein
MRDVAGPLQAARGRSALGVFIGQAELYCRNSDCSVRGVVLTIKEHDGPTTPATLCCPACCRSLKVHHVLTLAEQREAFDRDARISVNAQRCQQRTGDPAVPLRVLLDDELPGSLL